MSTDEQPARYSNHKQLTTNENKDKYNRITNNTMAKALATNSMERFTTMNI